jgi:hypothetical protein
LLLQFKEACPWVLEPYAGKSRYDNHAQRVAMGQRLMQAASDILLGWARANNDRDFFVRQLRDIKMSAPLDQINLKRLNFYADICGWTLARAHARYGDAATILAYADQTQRNHAALVEAVNSGRIKTIIEEDE